MPAPAIYAYVPDQLRELALDAKVRGLTFEEWWHEALPVRVCKLCGAETLLAHCPVVLACRLDDRQPVECGGGTKGAAPPTFANRREAGPRQVIWPTDATERKAWLAGVDSGREGWRDAYEGKPAQERHRALSKLREALRHGGMEGFADELAIA